MRDRESAALAFQIAQAQRGAQRDAARYSLQREAHEIAVQRWRAQQLAQASGGERAGGRARKR